MTLCNPMNYTVHGILQAGILELVAIPFSRGSSQCRDRTQSPTLQVDSLPAEPPGKVYILHIFFSLKENYRYQGNISCKDGHDKGQKQ